MSEAGIEPPADAPGYVPLPQTDKQLIEELRKRGYRVFKKERCRIYSAEMTVSYREVARINGAVDLMESIQQRMGADIGVEIFRAGACVRSTQDDYHSRIFRASAMAVLPNDFDFEREMWETRS